MSYADIILPQAGPPFFTYRVGEDLLGRLSSGCAVAVPLGARQIVGGIILRVHDVEPAFPTRPVRRLLFSRPIVSPEQMRLWEWMAEYYMCTPGEVMTAALPALLKPAGFSEEEFAADEFQARRVRTVALTAAASGEGAFNEECEKLRRRAPKQYHALVEIAALGPGPIPRSELKAGAAVLVALSQKGLIAISECEAATLPANDPPAAFRLPELSPAQRTALDELREALRYHNTALLFGVPSSGKSEVCFHAIAGTLAKGRDVLLMLPEIALTTHFVQRVRRVFGPGVVVYHSALSPRQRAETYIRLARSTGGTLVVGVRSAIFLPLPRPGLIVVDEEQDSSYKQSDPAPRYNARDAAIVLAQESGAKVILASATPSLETWANAQGGKYGLVELTERWGGTPPPGVTISDTLRSARRGERRGNFNKELLDRMAGALGRGEQAIVFRNRRGIAPFIECAECGHVPRCGHCAIPLSVHRDSLRCHYCGASTPLPSLCPACGGMNLATKGFGTEKIEEELARLFPAARVARLDRDSTTSERAFRRIIGDFEAGATDILVGTQMVTKGLDFAGVSVVGVLGADNLLNHPDFRASENAFALIMQVAGRAGRRDVRGQVVIQTVSPGSRLIAQAAAGDYRAMAADLLAERAMYGYPPYARLVRVMLRHSDREVLGAAAARLAELLRPVFGERLLGPQPPVVEKIKGEYALIFLLKAPRGTLSDGAGAMPMSTVRETLRATSAAILAVPDFRRITLTFDVDPR
ncbi:MAG: primosomal protein N' [Alistipes sp.]|jgi:primosomal protein N' (replication factor Y)|nr:primosomal protein N' [Alistipes sp.]